MSDQAAAAEAVPTGNTFDKYGSTNPVVKRLMAGFEGTLDEPGEADDGPGAAARRTIEV